MAEPTLHKRGRGVSGSRSTIPSDGRYVRPAIHFLDFVQQVSVYVVFSVCSRSVVATHDGKIKMDGQCRLVCRS